MSLDRPYLTGFADEAAPGIDDQIRITKGLGWDCIESRNIDGTNIHDLPEDQFDTVASKVEDAGVKVNCFGSSIANWGTSIDDPFEETLAKVERAIPRMNRLGTKLIRIMSFSFPESEEELKEEKRFARLREITDRFTAHGITPVHENCMTYGGLSYRHTLKMLENVPGLKLVFDTGNPVFNKDYSKPEPHPYQSSWEFYSHVREHVEYVHIKDARMGDSGKEIYTWPGEGDGDVVKILEDLVEQGYSGGVSIEPHLAVVFHEENDEVDLEQCESSYIEYGKRLMALLDKIYARVETTS